MVELIPRRPTLITMFHPQGPTFWELARQALSSTERGYDLLAPKFDFTPFRTPDSILQAAGRLVADGGKVGDALDLCCGTGAAMRMLRPLTQRRVLGTDFSQRMMEVARDRLVDAPGDARLDFVRCDVLQLPLAANSFDLASCFGALGHIRPNQEAQFVSQVARVLRPGGRFVFATSTMPPFWSRRYLFSRGFNAAMHVRNLLVRPPFVMFYLTFLLPGCRRLLEEHGFAVQVDQSLGPIKIVVATKSS